MKTDYTSLTIAYVIINLYLILRTRSFLKKFEWAKKPFRIVLLIVWLLLATLPLLGAFLPENMGLYTFQKYGNIFLGFLVYYAMILVAGEIVLLFFIKKKEMHTKIAKVLVCVACAGSLVVNGYGTIHAQNTKLITYDIETANSQGRELKIILLGDLHLSTNSNIDLTKKMVEMINEQDADMVLIAGDVFTSSYDGLENPELYSVELAKMKTTYGTYVVYGNHDVDETLFGGFSVDDPTIAIRPKTMDEFMVASNFHMLVDETETFEKLGLQVVGRVDGEKDGEGSEDRLSPKDVMKDTDDSMTQIVLEHEPWDFEELANNGADLILCGHTHAGQIFPGNLVVPFFNDNGWGYKELYGVPTVVTAGVGYYGPPLRVGTDSEVTLINLTY